MQTCLRQACNGSPKGLLQIEFALSTPSRSHAQMQTGAVSVAGRPCWAAATQNASSVPALLADPILSLARWSSWSGVRMGL